MTFHPLVSILIPAFNAERWIAATLASALEQTWPNKEIIVVDDGSTDKTAVIARQFTTPAVRIVANPNRGAAAARNAAFSLSRGAYIQWLDADDLLSPNKIELQMKLLLRLSSRRVLASCAFGKFMYRRNHAIFKPSSLWSDLTPNEWLIRKMGQNLFMQTATWLVSRELTEAAGPWNTEMVSDDDGEYFCRVLLNAKEIRFVPEATVYYRALGGDSLGYVDRSARKIDALWKSMKLHIKYLRSLENSPRSRAASVAYLQGRTIYFYPDRADIFKEAQEMAEAMGGYLVVPNLSWKYSWIKRLFGWRMAQRISGTLQRTKACAKRWIDKMLFWMEPVTLRIINQAK